MKGKVVIITGSSQGIGLSIAEYFGKFNAKICINGRNENALKIAKDKLTSLGIECISVVGDVSVLSDCEKLIQETILQFGSIDILINNAGISMRALFNDCNIEVIEKVMNINFWGTVFCTKLALPYIIKSQGSIVGISSIAGYRGLPARTGYSASKFAMQGFLEALRTELLHKNVHVLIACPGYTASNIRQSALNNLGQQQGETPLDESSLMTGEEVAKAIFNAVVKKKKILTLTTLGKLTVLLNKFFPAMMDKIVYNKIAKEKDSPFT